MDVELAEGVAVVRIDHPPVNAFDLGLVDDAVATVRAIQGPIVLTGAGKCFSAGVDLRAIIDGPPEYTDRFLAAVAEPSRSPVHLGSTRRPPIRR